MTEPVKTGLPIIGVVFLLLALYKFLQGDDWIVWLILGVVFGGLRIFASRTRAGENEHER